MAKRASRLTVILVPQAGHRSYSFAISPVWLAVAALVFAVLAGGFWHYRQETERLRAGLVEMEELRRTNRLQQAQIEEMEAKAAEIADRLHELELLEQQIQQLTGQASTAASRGGDDGEPTSGSAGRGGPQSNAVRQENLPTLATILPNDVRPYVLGRRDTLQLELRLARGSRSPVESVEAARQVNQRFAQQLQLLDESKEALAHGKEDLAAHLEYLAHRPTGMPVVGARITDRYGWRWSPFGWGRQHHNGIDLAQDYGSPIYATADGVVIHAGWKSDGYGYTVIIDHGYGFRTLYAHMSDWNVTYGQEVRRGEVIGWVGNTGLSTGPHLHYEVHLDGVPVDPAPYLQ